MFARMLFVYFMLVALTGQLSLLVAARPVIVASEGQAFTLTSLTHETVGAETRILIESSAPPLYTVFRPSPRLIIVDLPGGEGAALQPQYAIKSQLVDTVVVRETRSAASGRTVTRVEINVNGAVRDRSTVNGNTLVIALTPESSPANARQAADSSASTGVYVYPTPMVKTGAARVAERPATRPAVNRVEVERAAPRPAATRMATLIQNVRAEQRDGALRVVVDTNGAAQFKDFMLPNPWRIVVDITGVRSAIGNKTEPLNSAAVERLRVGQPAANVVRIVLDARAKVNYRVERDGESLVILVGDDGSTRREVVQPDAKAQSAARPVASGAENKPVASKPAESKPNDIKAAAQSADTRAAVNPKAAESKPQVKHEAQVRTPTATPAAPHKEVKVSAQRVENKPAASAAAPPAN